MAKLTTAARNALPSSAFVFPKTRKFPIHDEAHQRDALSRAAAKGGSVEKKVRAAVHRKNPRLGGHATQHHSKKRHPAHYRHSSSTRARGRG